MFIKSSDNKTIINIDNMADILLDLDTQNTCLITARSPKAVNHYYTLFEMKYRISDTTNAMGDEYYTISNPFHINYYQAVLFSTLEETVFEVDLVNGIIKVPQKDINNEYERIINPDTGEPEYNYTIEYKILYNEDGKPMLSPESNEDYYILQPMPVTITNKNEGQYVLAPTYMVHIVNATVIKDFMNDLYDKIREAIFNNENIDLYKESKKWYDFLFEEQTIPVYYKNTDKQEETDPDVIPVPSKYLLTNNKGFAVLEENAYVYINEKGDPIIDPDTGEPEVDEDGNIVYDIVPLRVLSVDYVVEE